MIWKAIEVLPVPVASQRQQEAVAARADGLQHAGHGDVLIEADLPAAALVEIGDGGEAITPGVLLGKGAVPQFLRRGETGGLALLAGGHVNGVVALAVAGAGEADLYFGGVILGLAHDFTEWGGVGLGFHHRQLGIAELEHIVGGERLAALDHNVTPQQSHWSVHGDAPPLH